MSRAFLLAASAFALSTPSAAQIGNDWAEVAENPARLAFSGPLSDPDTEVDFEVGDLDRDGWEDVVVARGPSGSSLGFRENVLLMNRGGVLTDETALFATASDVAGDLGFLTPTNDRDLVVIDVNADGWLDVVTATTLSDDEPKAVSHPRVYVNLGEDGAGSWLGLRYEEARIPQLFTVGGLPVAPRFCDVSAGDVNGDGAPDLYFIDYDNTQTGHAEAAGEDLNDRLLVNDGGGFFTDQSALHLTVDQLKSAFGNTTVVDDVNGDGHADIAKVTSLGVPYNVRIMYNDAAGQGQFQPLGSQDVGSNSPYGFDLGDLNADGRLDIAIQDDGSDRFRLNQGNDPLGRAIWGPLKVFQFAGGSDDGFGHKVRIADFDGDGWSEVFICDFDIEFKGCLRRLHIYHNTGGEVGGDVVLREEAELTSPTTGWKGVEGLQVADLRGTMDIGLHDFDEDGDVDLLLGNCGGTRFWENQAVTAPVVCQASLGFAGPGAAVLSVCGDDLTTAGSAAELKVQGAASGAPAVLALSSAQNPVSLGFAVLVPNPILGLVPAVTDADGELHLDVFGKAGTPAPAYVQAAIVAADGIEVTNALEVVAGT
ncbi:MAG: VCBS repeat-containing protein [Planctomycetota bacterium]